MKKFDQNPGVEYLNDVTAFGIMRRYKEDIEMGRLRHLMFPDLCTPLARQSYTVNTLIAFLNGLTEEGITAIETYAQPGLRLRMGAHRAVGIITGITKTEMYNRRSHFLKVGFLSRMLPVSYTYRTATKHKIQDSIAIRQYHHDSKIMLDFPFNPWKINLPEALAREFIRGVNDLPDEEKLFGFRKQKQLQTLMMGSALSERREEVQQKDLDLIIDLADFIGTRKEKAI